MAYFTNMQSHDLINWEITGGKEIQLRKRGNPNFGHWSEMAVLISLLMSHGQRKEKTAPRITAFAILGPLWEASCTTQCAWKPELPLRSLSLWFSLEAPAERSLSLLERVLKPGRATRKGWGVPALTVVGLAWKSSVSCILMHTKALCWFPSFALCQGRLSSEATCIYLQSGPDSPIHPDPESSGYRKQLP
jgi:hypothetical protein